MNPYPLAQTSRQKPTCCFAVNSIGCKSQCAVIVTILNRIIRSSPCLQTTPAGERFKKILRGKRYLDKRFLTGNIFESCNMQNALNDRYPSDYSELEDVSQRHAYHRYRTCLATCQWSDLALKQHQIRILREKLP